MPSNPLPFLKDKKTAGALATEHIGGDPGMEAAASDLLKAIAAGDAKAVAAALQAAFELADSMPHVEGEHE